MLPLISSVIVVGFCHNTPASHTRNIWSIGPLVVLGHWQFWIFASFSSTGSLEWMGTGPDWLQSTSARMHRGSNRILGQWFTVRGEELTELNKSGWTTAGTKHQWHIMASEQSAAGYVDCLAYLACLINHRSLLGLSVLPHGVLGVLSHLNFDFG